MTLFFWITQARDFGNFSAKFLNLRDSKRAFYKSRLEFYLASVILPRERRIKFLALIFWNMQFMTLREIP